MTREFPDWMHEGLEALLAEKSEALGEGFKLDIPSIMTAMKHAFIHDVGYVEVRRHEDEAVGFIFGVVVPHLLYGNNWGFVHLVWVTPDFRRQGIGSSMISNFEKWAKERDAVRVVVSDNTRATPDGTSAAYEGLGFQKHETIYIK